MRAICGVWRSETIVSCKEAACGCFYSLENLQFVRGVNLGWLGRGKERTISGYFETQAVEI